jgi:hypothetical protein
MSEKGWRFLGVGKELGGIKEMFDLYSYINQVRIE